MARAPKAWLVPEVLQTSLMDCGPAVLKAVLEGFGHAVPYDLIRERCATDVDGTSMAALARLGRELGLETHQMLLPQDCLLLREAHALPAIVVTRGPSGLFHFNVLWSVVGDRIQVMDPGAGRRWLRKQQLVASLPSIPVAIASSRWRRWMSSSAAEAVIAARLRALGVSGKRTSVLLDRAAADPTWQSFARLDAAVRMLTQLAAGSSSVRGARAQRLLLAAIEPEACTGSGAGVQLPQRYFWAVGDARAAEQLTLHGAVIVHVAGRLRHVRPSARRHAPARSSSAGDTAQDKGAPNIPKLSALSARLQTRLHAASFSPMHWLWSCVLHDARTLLVLVALALAALAFVVPIEAVLLRALLDAPRSLGLQYQRLAGIGAASALIFVTLALEHWTASAARELGRRLELRLRAALLEKLPRLEDHYLRSRPVSDMAARGNALHMLREVPVLWIEAARAFATVLGTGLGLIWLDPTSAGLIASMLLVSVLLPLGSSRSMAEGHVRLRTNGAALDRFYLDALLGVHPIRVHGAERAMQTGYEALLTDWARTARSLHAQGVLLQALQLFAGTALVLLLLTYYVTRGGPLGGVLLFAFWLFRVPSAGQTLVATQLALRQIRSVALRLLAPLSAAEPDEAVPLVAARENASGVHLMLEGVSVFAHGHTLLADLQLEIPAGSHVAIVGPSGSGKSSLLGLFLGWRSPSRGRIEVDGNPLDAARLAALRERTAWVDPAVQVWNRSLYENLIFGGDPDPDSTVPDAMARTGVSELLERMQDGVHEQLGEGGVRLSGGESQRVRLARAWSRKQARLLLLDEPFRGLERAHRRELLRQARAHWSHATVLFVSHDVEDSLDCDRVLVMDSGRIIEAGDPRVLVQQRTSRYAELVAAEQTLRAELWSHEAWQRYTIRDGRLERRDEP